MHIQILDSLADLEARYGSWLDLWQRQAERGQTHVFAHPDWVLHSYRLAEGDNIRFVAVIDGSQKLHAALPFSVANLRVKPFQYRALRHGAAALSDYAGILCDPSSNTLRVMRRVLDVLHSELFLGKDRLEVLYLDLLNDANDAASALLRDASSLFTKANAAHTITARIDFRHSYGESKKIANIRRRQRNAGGNWQVIHQRGSQIETGLLADFRALHRRAYPGAGFGGAFAERLFATLLEAPEFSDFVQLSVLHTGDELLAGHFGFRDLQRFYYYVPAYAQEHARHGPGQYLLWQLIEQSQDNGLACFDFLRGSESYKYEWANAISANHVLLGIAPELGSMRHRWLQAWMLRRKLLVS